MVFWYYYMKKFPLLASITLTSVFSLSSSIEGAITIYRCKSNTAIDFSDNPIHGYAEYIQLYGTELGISIKDAFNLEPLNAFGCQTHPGFSPEDATFTKHGSVGRMERISNSSESMWVWYSVKEYCVDTVPGKEEWIRSIHLLDCSARKSFKTLLLPDTSSIQITKCCPPGYALAGAGGVPKTNASSRITSGPQCVEAVEDWAPRFYDSKLVNQGRCIQPSPASQIPKYRIVTHLEHQNILLPEIAKGKNFDYFGLPRKVLRNSAGKIVFSRSRWRILDNGSFVYYLPSYNRWHLRGRWEQFQTVCADAINLYAERERTEIAYQLTSREDEEEYVSDTGNNLTLIGLEDNALADLNGTNVNYYEEEEDAFPSPSTGAILYVVFFYSSLVPLILTILAYCLTWKAQNIHGWTVLSHLICLACLNLFLGISHHLPMHNYIEDIPGCAFVGVVAIFFFLASFMWLTMINFDLWWTFRVLNARGNGKSVSRYMIYATLSFGVPLVFVSTAYALDVAYGELGYDSDCDILVPNFGVNRCYMEPNAEGIFVYYPLLLLLCLNLIFFVLTVSKIYNVQTSTKKLLKHKSGVDKSSLSLFSKLFLVMGVSCVFEFISWFSHPEIRDVRDTPIFFLAVDYFNIFVRAIGIFVIFGCTKQVREEVRKILVSLGVLEMSQVKPSNSGTMTTSQNTIRMTEMRAVHPSVRDKSMSVSSNPE